MTPPLLCSVTKHLDTGLAICDLSSLELLEFNPKIQQWLGFSSDKSNLSEYLTDKENKRLSKAIDKKRVFRITKYHKIDNREACIEIDIRAITLEYDVLLIQAQRNDSREETKALIKSYESMIEQKNLLLVEEKNKVELANKAKSVFLATISHELRTPLNAILGFSNLMIRKLKKGGDSNYEQATSLAEKIIHAANCLTIIVENIFQVSDIDRNKKQILNYTSVDIQELSGDIKSYYSLLDHNHDITFDVRISDDIPSKITTDKRKLQQLIFHLLSNAHKFTSSGTITLEISKNQNNQNLLICISDTGIGIGKEFQEKMYTAFLQEDDALSRTHGGTGIGLSICANIVKLMLGEISCKSTKNEGTTMTISIPINQYSA